MEYYSSPELVIIHTVTNRLAAVRFADLLDRVRTRTGPKVRVRVHVSGWTGPPSRVRVQHLG